MVLSGCCPPNGHDYNVCGDPKKGVDVFDYLIFFFAQAPLWEGGQTVLGLEEGGIHMKLVNSK